MPNLQTAEAGASESLSAQAGSAQTVYAQTGLVQIQLREMLPGEAQLCSTGCEVRSMQTGLCSEAGDLLCSRSGSLQPASGARMCRSGAGARWWRCRSRARSTG